MVVRSLLLGPLFRGLSTPERQQLSIRGEDLSHGVLERASLLDQRADLLHPFLRDPLDALLAIHHERQRPTRMSLSLGAPAVGLSAAAVREGERAGQSVWRDLQTPKQSVLALTQASGRISFSTVPVHLVVVLHQGCALSMPFLRWGTLRRAPTQRSSVPTRHYGLGPEPLSLRLSLRSVAASLRQRTGAAERGEFFQRIKTFELSAEHKLRLRNLPSHKVVTVY